MPTVVVPSVDNGQTISRESYLGELPLSPERFPSPFLAWWIFSLALAVPETAKRQDGWKNNNLVGL